MTRSTGKESDVAEESDACGVEVVHAEAVRAARLRVPSDPEIARAVEIAGLLSNPTRLRIVTALGPSRDDEGIELCVCDLASVAATSETHTSHNLRALRLAGVVTQRRDGRLVYYRLADDPVVRGMVAAVARARVRSS